MANRTYQPFINVSPEMADTVAAIGHTLRLSGLIFQGMGETVYFYLPDNIPSHGKWSIPTIEEWVAILAQSDDPIIFKADETGQMKPWIRKSQSAISGLVQQQIWVRDKFECMYCQRRMGGVMLTIDHFIPLELGGENNPGNYLSACRRCNKDKGNMSPVVWCEKMHLNYIYFVNYLKNKTR